MSKLIIEARVNEYATRGPNPHVPYTPEEIAADAAQCRAAGAAIVHFHAREADGSPAHETRCYADVIRAIRMRTDVLVHPTLGAATLDAAPAARIDHVVALAGEALTRADFAPMDMGSANIDFYDRERRCFRTTENIYRNSTGTLQHFARAIGAAGLKHYVVSWSVGFTRQALAFIDMGLLPEPVFLLFVLTDGGLLAGHPGTPAGLEAHLQMLPRERRIEWAVCNHGGDLMPLVDPVIDAGGHIAIGLGDFPYADPHPLTNAALIERVAARAAAAGRPLAEPADVRAMLAMTHSQERA